MAAKMKAIVLAAGVGKRLREFSDKPKCLLRIGAESLLSRYFRCFSSAGIDSVVVVTGYKHELVVQELDSLDFSGDIEIIHNPEFEKGSIVSLWSAHAALDDAVLLMDADVYFEQDILARASSSDKQDFFLLDTTSANDGEAVMVGFEKGAATALARGLSGGYSVLGEMVGFTRLSRNAARKMREVLAEQMRQENLEIGYEFLFPQLFDEHSISYELVDGLRWVEIDFPEDVERAQALDALIREVEPGRGEQGR